MSDKIGVTELNEIILNSMLNSWYKQGFHCGSISFKKASNTFEHMETAESIYGVVVEPSYKKPTRVDTNSDGHSINKRGDSPRLRLAPRRVIFLASAQNDM